MLSVISDNWALISVVNWRMTLVSSCKIAFDELNWQPNFALCSYLSIYTTKSLQSCPTLCDPRDGSPPGSPVPGILQARTLEWVAISFSQYIHWKVVIAEESRFLELRENWSRKMCTNGSSVNLDNEQCNPIIVEISCGPKLSCSYGAWDGFGFYSIVVAANLQTFDKVLLENWVFQSNHYIHIWKY